MKLAFLIHDNASANENVFIWGAKSTKEAKVSEGSIAGGERADPCLTSRPKIIVVESALVGIDGKVGTGGAVGKFVVVAVGGVDGLITCMSSAVAATTSLP